MGLPLTGIKVFSLTRLLPGAYCTMLLSNLGAEVIMLEHPDGGDPMRLRPTHFSAMNRNKKSITVNLKTEKGKDICYRLSRQSDIFIESFRPGVVARLGIDYDSIKKINPDIIYTSISGFGQDGPYKYLPGHDIIYQGVAGMLADKVSRGTEGFTAPALPTADLSSGMFASFATLAALYDLKILGKGHYVDCSMTDGLVSWMSIILGDDSEFKYQPPLAGYGIFKAADGKYLSLGIDEEQHFWRNLCGIIGRGDLSELSTQDRRDKYDALNPILEGIFLTRPRDVWVKMLVSADIPASPVNTKVDEVLNDPQLAHRGMILEADDPEKGKTKQVGSPLKISGLSIKSTGKSPALGEHNQEILLALGYSKDEIQRMKEEAVI